MITLTDVEKIIELYEKRQKKFNEEECEWYADDNNVGFPFPQTWGDVCYDVYKQFCEIKINNLNSKTL